jgi:hypothetical protein
MASRNPSASKPSDTESNVTALPSKPKPPEGLERVASDVSAFWNPALGPIYGTLVGAKDTRNKRGQIVRIYIFSLLEPCPALARKMIVETKAGDVIGIWGTAGLADLDQLGGCRVWIRKISVRPSQCGCMTSAREDRASPFGCVR